MSRKAIQISTNYDGTTALCDDGTMWFTGSRSWEQLPPLPLPPPSPAPAPSPLPEGAGDHVAELRKMAEVIAGSHYMKTYAMPIHAAATRIEELERVLKRFQREEARVHENGG